MHRVSAVYYLDKLLIYHIEYIPAVCNSVFVYCVHVFGAVEVFISGISSSTLVNPVAHTECFIHRVIVHPLLPNQQLLTIG